jgi:hypothetical protein
MRLCLCKPVVFLAIHPTNQPILPNSGNQPTSRPDFGNQSNLRCQIAGWLVVDHSALVDSYEFHAHGLVRKTMNISVNGISHHIVSYYKVNDVKHNLLSRPLQDPRLQHISVKPELYLKHDFRALIEENEYYVKDRQMYAHLQVMYSMTNGGQTIRLGQCPGMYALVTTSNAGGAVMYGTMPDNQ